MTSFPCAPCMPSIVAISSASSASVAAAELSSQPIVYVSDDHLVDWGVPGQRNTSPDVGVFVGLKEEVGLWAGTFDLKASGGRCLLVVEVVSPDRRRENDVVHKFREYYQAGRSPLRDRRSGEREGTAQGLWFPPSPRGLRGTDGGGAGTPPGCVATPAGLKDGSGRVPRRPDRPRTRRLQPWGLSGTRRGLAGTGRGRPGAFRNRNWLSNRPSTTAENSGKPSRRPTDAFRIKPRRARPPNGANEIKTQAREAAELRERDQTQAREARRTACQRTTAGARRRLKKRDGNRSRRVKRPTGRARRLEKTGTGTGPGPRGGPNDRDRLAGGGGERRPRSAIRQLEAALRALQPPS